MWTLLLIEAASRALLGLAPRPFRLAWQQELLATVRDSCLEAGRADGWRGLLTAGVLEMSSVGKSAIRARLGLSAPVTAGGSGGRGRGRQAGRRSAAQLLAHDLRLAARSLVAGRTPAVLAVVTLALGVGINTAIFSILDSTVLRPAPYADADRLDEIWTMHTDSGVKTPGNRREVILEWRRQTDLFDRVEAYDITTFIDESEAGAEMVTGTFVTPGLLSMLGVKPVSGRLFAPGEGRGGTADRVVISERLWRRRFLADPLILEREVTFSGTRYRVIGVMPASFRFPTGGAEFWVPYDIEAPPPELETSPPDLVPVARRRQGLTADEAVEIVTARGEQVQAAGGAPAGRGASLGMLDFVDVTVGRSLYVLAGAVAFLLLIVCANLANLSLSRALTRTRDFALRASLGASRGDLLRETFVEHLLIGSAGAVLGLVIAHAALALTVDHLPSTFVMLSKNVIDIDGRALAFTALAGVFATILFGMPPAWIASRTGPSDGLRSSSRSTTGSHAARRLRSALVVTEVMLAIVLLVGSALMARSFVKLQTVERGFDARGLVTLRVGLPKTGYSDPYAQDAFVEALLSRVLTIPGVGAATAGSAPPGSDLISFGQLEFAGRAEPTELLVLPVYEVWPDYFETTGIPILAGRVFSRTEPADSVIVSESFAREYFGEDSAIGQVFHFEGDEAWNHIVGVAGEVRQLGMDDLQGSYELYRPLRRPPGLPPPSRLPPGAIAAYRTLTIRADDPAAVTEALRQAVHHEDTRVVVWRLESVEHQFADAVARPRVVLLLMSVFAGFGLVLAAAGIYGVLSYTVAQRRREIGIRLALGAVPRTIGRLVIGNGLVLTGYGLALGIAAALGLVRVMRALLYEVEPTDPFSVGIVAVLLLGTAVTASWWPARRAMRVDPVMLLREE